MTVQKIEVETSIKRHTLGSLAARSYFRFENNSVVFIKTLTSVKDSEYVEVFNTGTGQVDRYGKDLKIGQLFTHVTLNLKETVK